MRGDALELGGADAHRAALARLHLGKGHTVHVHVEASRVEAAMDADVRREPGHTVTIARRVKHANVPAGVCRTLEVQRRLTGEARRRLQLRGGVGGAAREAKLHLRRRAGVIAVLVLEHKGDVELVHGGVRIGVAALQLFRIGWGGDVGEHLFQVEYQASAARR